MHTDRADLERRISAATRRDTVRGVVFNSAFGLINEIAGRSAVMECDPAGKGKRSEFFSYPVAEYLRLAWGAADLLAIQLGGPDGVFRELGRRASLRWLVTPLGRALLAFTGRDPRRLLANVANGYRNVVSYGTRTIEWLNEHHARLVFRRDFLVPPFHCGAIEAALETVCGSPFRVEGSEIGFLESEYDVTW